MVSGAGVEAKALLAQHSRPVTVVSIRSKMAPKVEVLGLHRGGAAQSAVQRPRGGVAAEAAPADGREPDGVLSPGADFNRSSREGPPRGPLAALGRRQSPSHGPTGARLTRGRRRRRSRPTAVRPGESRQRPRPVRLGMRSDLSLGLAETMGWPLSGGCDFVSNSTAIVGATVRGRTSPPRDHRPGGCGVPAIRVWRTRGAEILDNVRPDSPWPGSPPRPDRSHTRPARAVERIVPTTLLDASTGGVRTSIASAAGVWLPRPHVDRDRRRPSAATRTILLVSRPRLGRVLRPAPSGPEPLPTLSIVEGSPPGRLFTKEGRFIGPPTRDPRLPLARLLLTSRCVVGRSCPTRVLIPPLRADARKTVKSAVVASSSRAWSSSAGWSTTQRPGWFRSWDTVTLKRGPLNGSSAD